jgi:hypothetical protein
VIALDLARELLKLHPEKVALVVSHENITNNFYSGETHISGKLFLAAVSSLCMHGFVPQGWWTRSSGKLLQQQAFACTLSCLLPPQERAGHAGCVAVVLGSWLSL